MAQELIQTQEQKLQQVQRLTQQQMLQVRLTEMPVAELEENVRAELDDNPALEVASADGFDQAEGYASTADGGDDSRGPVSANSRDAMSDDSREQAPDEEYRREREREERASALDDALEGIGRDDEMPPSFHPNSSTDNADYEEMVWGDTTSFYDKLREQVGEQDITPRERSIIDYVIGSLDSDGLLRKDADTLCDELEIFQNVECTPADVQRMMDLLKTFDPAGIGAADLRECLLLQLYRREQTPVVRLTTRILTDSYKDFIAKHWDALRKTYHMSDDTFDDFRNEIRRLNPKPGAALGEAEGRSLQQVTPDFVVETLDDGTTRMYLNSGEVPELKVSPSFAEMVETYRNNRRGMSRQDKEALLYAKEKVEKAQGYIEAIRQRRATLTKTMAAIVDWQRRFFADGDEADLRPMVLKDIAAKTGLDISTVSRVCSVKYVQTNWGVFPLKFFFNSSFTGENGDELSSRSIKLTLRDIVDHEDKSAPYSDEALSRLMAERGCPVARRTVSKYREQLGIASAKQRRE